MRHHFGDLLDRDGDYWTTVPNRERHAHRVGDVPEGSPDITIATVGKDDAHGRRALTLPNLEELTLHEPSPEQLDAVAWLPSLARLRVTHARPKDIGFIGAMRGLQEVVLEHVSGFDDLAPLGTLPKLRSLHLENLRRVSDFGGLAGAPALRYLSINGTLDGQQPIADFEFLRGLPDLEVLAMWQFRCAAPWPATLPITGLRRLKRLRVHHSFLPTAEIALMEEGLAGVKGASWGPFTRTHPWTVALPADDPRASLSDDEIRAHHPEISLIRRERRVAIPNLEEIVFTGRAAGMVKCSSKTVQARCTEKTAAYEAFKRQARELLGTA